MTQPFSFLPTSTNEKLYVLVRKDLPRGAQLAQSVHAAVELQRKYETPEVVVVLEVSDEDELLDWADRAVGYCDNRLALRVPYWAFYEPDINEHTALAMISTGEALAHLPLAGRSRWRRFKDWVSP